MAAKAVVSFRDSRGTWGNRWPARPLARGEPARGVCRKVDGGESDLVSGPRNECQPTSQCLGQLADGEASGDATGRR